MAASGGSKTEKPTPQRLRRAREQGQFVASRGLIGAVQFLGFVATLSMLGDWPNHWRISLQRSLDRAIGAQFNLAEVPALIVSVAMENLTPILGVTIIPFAASAAAHLVVTRGGFSLQRVTPKFDRLNPFVRLKELPRQNAASVVQALCLLTAMALVINALMQTHAADLLRLPLENLTAASMEMAQEMRAMLWKAAAVFVVFGAADFLQQQRKYNESLRMTKEEVKEENKRNEGDPQMKARIRRLRRDLLRRQMMREVPKATAVIVNPTHFAVAIRYDSETMACPVVVAKGKNWLALRIRQIAVMREVPVIENAPLARALYDAIEVGRAISPEFYKAIAEILAYVYRLMGRKLRG
ncbi:MAG: EscU/YscU/HrcU family type III secretion system export apparatus switch protein [Acidobacteriaceae bacterium]|nr:EscU/YscU/HrcU family type III secretion system export apparatus switch protein [Acidobacteriaceae bacterium]